MTLPAGTCFYPTSTGNSSTTNHWQVAQSAGCSVTASSSSCSTKVGSSAYTVSLPTNTSVAVRYFPATFYLKTTTALPTNYGYTGLKLTTGLAPDGTSLYGYEIKPANFASTAQYTAAIQNFANWFQYYRKRHQALRAGLGGAFLSLTNTRVAGFTINNSASPTSPDVSVLDIGVTANRTSLYQQFYQSWTGTGGTPNRPAVANIVRNFKRTDTSAPIQYACQLNFGMLFTDGFSYALESGDGFDTVGNIDGTKGAPYADSTSNTMADGVMGAYTGPLRTGTGFTAGKVPISSACGTSTADPSLDCNNNLHMNFYAITLGTRGLQFNSDAPVNPYTVSPAIVWPTATQLAQSRNPVAVDDLWHSTINGRGALLNASSPQDIANKLGSVLQSIAARRGAAASVAMNSGSLSTDTRVYQGGFDSSSWSGKLESFKINADGTLALTAEWNAANQMPAAASRNIFAVNTNGASVAFRWANLDATRQTQLQQSDTVDLAKARVDYLRGDPSQEQRQSGVFRNRDSALGDLINSAPMFVGTPAFRYPDTLEAKPYSTFKSDKKDRTQAVYVGANDGMLHAFNAGSGTELFAFVPGGVFANLYRLTQPLYTHRYFVDGTPTVVDAYFGSAWHTVLASGLGGGGQSVFALDVTSPNYTEGGTSTPFLWEFTDAQDADLGYTFSRPSIARMKNGKWAAVFGNGYNNTATDTYTSSTGNAVLYVVDVQTGGTPIRKIDTGVGKAQDPLGLSRPNGLATPVMVDADGDGITDYAYAGDLFGNLWKFKFTDSAPGNWDVAYKSGTTATPLYVAVNSSSKRQPITSKPSVSRGSNGQGLLIAFGTGKYLETSDTVLANLTTQTFYGIIDANSGTTTDIVSSRSQLTQQQIIYESTTTFGSNTALVRAVTNNAIGSNRGWYLDLLSPTNGFEGEMQVTDPLIRDGQVIFTTLIPNADPCSYGGRSWLMTLNLKTGGRVDVSPYDLNGDQKFTDSDYVTLSDGSRVATAGLQTNVGVTARAGLLGGEDGGNGDDTGCDYLVMRGSTGETQTVCRNPGPRATGRQSWRQIR
jgi:type IV pilus assembly protein PilY1